MQFFEIVFDNTQGFRSGDVVNEDRLQNCNTKYLLKVGAIKVSKATEEAIVQEVNLTDLNVEMADLRSQVKELTADKEALEADLKKANDEIATLKKPK